MATISKQHDVPTAKIEDREERFKRLAMLRVNGMLDKLKLLGQLSNRRNYIYTEAQVATIFRAINREIKVTMAKFEHVEGAEKKFKL